MNRQMINGRINVNIRQPIKVERLLYIHLKIQHIKIYKANVELYATGNTA